jgi:hypothetical protein
MTSRDLDALSAGPPTARIAYGSSSWPAVYGAFKTSFTQDSHSVKRTGSLLPASHGKARVSTADRRRSDTVFSRENR